MPRYSFVVRPLGPVVAASISNSTLQLPRTFQKLCKVFLLALVCSLALVTAARAQDTIFNSSVTPVEIDSSGTSSIELGVKFRADSNGYITGLRFYKAKKNVGTHIGHLWSRSGVLLGSATFTSESSTGWQQVNFSSPIPVTANTTYIASYFCPKGHYSQNNGFFASAAVNNPPLHALANGTDGPNGVYIYTSSTSVFPTSTFQSTNFWVDVVYTPQATVANPQLSVSSAGLSFGSQTVNTAATQSITLTSSGTSALTINSASITGAGFSIVGGSLPVTLNAGQATTLQVQFKPTAAGAVSGQLAISSNSTTGSTATVALSGTATAAPNPRLSVSSASLSFGSQTVNTAATQSITLTSSGTSALTINSASISGAGFSIVSGSLPVTLNAGQATTLQVQFKPTATGAVSGQLAISSNSTSGSTTAVSLSGTATAASNPQLSVSSASLSFGSQTVSTTATQSLTLTSSGTSALTINSASITGAGFSIVASTFPMTLNAGQSVTLQIQFAPTATGAVSGQLIISSNSTSGGTASVALSGTATAAVNPQLTVSSASLSFGSVTANTATTESVTLTSSGTSAVTVNSASITGAGFSIIGASFPMTLTAGQTATLQIQFEPTVAGAVTGQLTISSNSTTGSSALVALSGTGAAVSHTVDLSWQAPATSADPVAGYNIYRTTTGGTPQLLNPSPMTQTTYADTAVVSGTTYTYFATSVDAKGIQSTDSNQVTVTVATP